MDIHFLHAAHFYPEEVAALDPILAILLATLEDTGAVSEYLWYMVHNNHEAKEAALALRQRAKQDYLRLLYTNFPQYKAMVDKESV